MIPRAHVTHWRARAPWPTDAQVEQDLVLSRALVELFSDPGIAQALAFRGGTALHKLFFEAPGRYSEDIDLVQRTSAAIGPTFDAIRARLDPWLGEARSKQGEGRASLVYRFESTSLPVQRMRLKVEINTREHFTVLGAHSVPFAVESPWFAGEARLATFGLEELLGTKLRALYQRKKGRDLYDLWLALSNTSIDDAKVVACFEHYLAHSGAFVARADFESNVPDPGLVRLNLAAPGRPWIHLLAATSSVVARYQNAVPWNGTKIEFGELEPGEYDATVHVQRTEGENSPTSREQMFDLREPYNTKVVVEVGKTATIVVP